MIKIPAGGYRQRSTPETVMESLKDFHYQVLYRELTDLNPHSFEPIDTLNLYS